MTAREEVLEHLTEDQIVDAVEADDNLGFCIACGEETSGVEPDARCIQCEDCLEHKVFGAEELLLIIGA